MNSFSIKTSDNNTVGKLLGRVNGVQINGLNWYKDEITKGDLIFLVISGDDKLKPIKYDNGLCCIGFVSKGPHSFTDKNFSITISNIHYLDRIFTKNDFYKYPDLKDARNIGPETKSSPNQAIGKIEEIVAKRILKILKVEFMQNLDISTFNTIDYNHVSFDKLSDVNDLTVVNDKLLPKIKSENDSLIKEFVIWFNEAENFKKSYPGLVDVDILRSWDDIFFNNKMFSIYDLNVSNLIESKKKLLETANKSERWASFNESTSRGAPNAILGSNNYLKFLTEFDLNKIELFDIELNKLVDAFKQFGFIFNENLLHRLVSSLMTKPFTILTGLSGSGKTKIAQAFSSWICEKDNNQCLIVPVGADWTNREPLLGYPNALNSNEYIKPDSGVIDLLIEATKEGNKNKPYFLILDEMNLSHVERYFADFLSLMESGEELKLHTSGEIKDVPKSIKMPKNLFVIGTVNIDETTYMFSPKVLDRAGVIEFRVDESEMQTFLVNPIKPDLDSIAGLGASMAADFVRIATNDAKKYAKQDELNNDLIKFFSELKKVGAEFGYRTAFEINRFAGIVNSIVPVGEEWSVEQITDAAIIQKLLPKLHGSQRKLSGVLKTLAGLCLIDQAIAEKMLDSEYDLLSNEQVASIKYPLSFEKIHRMYQRAKKDGFTSFAEA